MRKIRTAMLLALTALAAVAVAAPATASAAQWTKEGKPLTQEAGVQLKGSLTWIVLGTHSFSCEFEGEASLSPGDEGAITGLKLVQGEEEEIPWNACPGPMGGTGAYTGCIAESFQAENLPWSMEAYASGEDIGIITEHDVHFQFLPGSCAGGTTTYKTKGTTWVELDNPSAASAFIVPMQQIPGYAVHLTGEFEVTPAGVYGIE